MTYIESSILVKCIISKASYYQGDLKENDMHQLTSVGIAMFLEVEQHLKVIKVNNSSNNKIDENTKNHANLYYLMGNVFSILHSKEEELRRLMCQKMI